MSLQQAQKVAIQTFIQSITFDGYNLILNINDTGEIQDFPFLRIKEKRRSLVNSNTHQSRHNYSYELTCDYELEGKNPISEEVINELQTAIVSKLESSRTALQTYDLGAGKVWIDMVVPNDERIDISTNKRRVIFTIETMVISTFR
jgi:hypothetical protein